MNLRQQHVTLETDRYCIEGELTLPGEGFRSRLSDYVNQRDLEFFSIQDATVTPLDGTDQGKHAAFTMIARRHVRLVTPASAPDDDRDR